MQANLRFLKILSNDRCGKPSVISPPNAQTNICCVFVLCNFWNHGFIAELQTDGAGAGPDLRGSWPLVLPRFWCPFQKRFSHACKLQ